MVLERYLILVFLFVVVSIGAGCQPKVYLMPSPVGLDPSSELFHNREDNKDDNLLYTLYATNRLPFTKNKKGDLYSIFPSDTLKLGWVVHRVGDEPMSWEEIYQQSLAREREKELVLTSEHIREVVNLDIEDDLFNLSPQADGLFDQIDEWLDRSFDKDILIYVHGANCNFYRATAQGAQFFHFTGHNSVVITFSWPSAENILRYKTDVAHARKTIPAFTRLIELLATHTQARNINILAYSAGAQVVAPGLAALRDQYMDEPSEAVKRRLRIGEVYFAAPDTAFKPFISRYMKFKDLVSRTTINLNSNDSVLKWSTFQNGVSRLGRPKLSELSDNEIALLLEAMKSTQLNVIDVGGSESLEIGSAHDSWYNHPWVSMDVLLLLLFNANPEERGLREYWAGDEAKLYRFPENYDRDLHDVLRDNQESLGEKLRLKGQGPQQD
ncbi:alpha/beta hydrolase [Desulfopila sp. IMCC35008]|uniref:alpha/beta hydrolase n=1 Tax=Desulfopila sp. IMCC35008 TaxID=2653858 RepID=UPI0013D52AD7|nr:alpha/beta hydrolase [Desulfopila sp. IMCC35008]